MRATAPFPGMRGAWLALLLIASSMAGCFDFLEDGPAREGVRPADVEDDPADYRVIGVRVWGDDRDEVSTVESADGTSISLKVYEPITRDARPDGDPIRFPVLYLFHGWGWAKEYFENAPMGEPSEEDPSPLVNQMQRFAKAGFITVAYDIRGFGQSGGTVTLASAADVQDFLAVHRHVEGNFTTNGRVGVAGPSLGAGMSMRMLADSGVVDAAANLFGWADLYDAIVPGDVPKAEWAVLLYGVGQGGSRARLHSEITEWMAKAVQRTDMASVEAALDTRSTVSRLPQSDVPLFLCQGMQESLFPQVDLLWSAHGGFTRTHVYTGGHVSETEVCWDKVIDWMDYFLRGVDTQVDDWPFLETVDADPEVHALGFSQEALGRTAGWMRYLHEDSLVEGPSQRTFSVTQYVAANPLQEPAVVGDRIGSHAVPEDFRQDPGAVFFDSGALDATQVVLGAPVLRLVPDDATRGVPFQVIATLYVVDADGSSRLLTRGAYAHLAEQEDAPEAIEVRLDWTKATLHAGSRVVLKLGANDPGWFFPMPPDQQTPGAAAAFSGTSNLTLPFFEG